MFQRGTYIFITGLFRSGTTLLTRALSAHPNVEIVYQPFTSLFQHTIRKFWQENGYKQSRPMGDPLILERFYRKFNECILSTVYTEREIEEIKVSIRKDYETDSIERSKDACRAFDNARGITFFELFLSAMNNLRGFSGKNEETMWGIKEIWCEDFLPAFVSQDDVTIKCIHVIRDPRAVIVSRNYGKYLQGSGRGQKYPVLFIARSWRRSIELYRKLYGTNNYFLVSYEDIVNSPEEVLREINDYLGIKFNFAMLDYSRYCGGDGKAWRGNIGSRQFNSIDKDNSNRWKEIISVDDLFLCEFLCSNEMEDVGYGLITDHLDEERFLSYDEDVSAEKSWLCAYGHCLNEEQKKIEISRLRKIQTN